LQSKKLLVWLNNPFAAWRVQSKVAKFWWLYHFCQSTINPSSKQREVIFWQNWHPKVCRSIPQIRPIPRIPILSLIGAISVKNFQENSLTLTSCSRLVFSRYSEQLFPTPIDFPKPMLTRLPNIELWLNQQ